MTTAVMHAQRQKIVITVFGLAWIACMLGIFLWSPLGALAALGASALLALCIWKPFIPLMFSAILFPFIQLEIQIGGFNAPYVDIIALLGFVGWAIRSIVFASGDTAYFKRIEWPFILLSSAWIATAVISSVTSVDVLHGLYATMRPIAFFYFVFVLFPVNAIRSQRALRQLTAAMVIVATLIACIGLYGFFTIPVERVIDHRAAPVALFGINILGGNQNSIANVIVIALPLAWYFLRTEKKARMQKVIFLAIGVQAAALLLTFSRTAWLALLLQLGCIAVVQYRARLFNHLRGAVVVALLLVPLLGYMIFFSIQDAVRSSNENRGILFDVAVEMFTDRPLFGQGPGTFMQFVERNTIYTQEFGAPLDAHGFIQKVGSEMGVFGLAIFTIMLAAVVMQIARARKRFQHTAWGSLLSALLLSVMGTIFFQLFQTSYYIGVMWLPIGFGLAACAVAYREQQRV